MTISSFIDKTLKVRKEKCGGFNLEDIAKTGLWNLVEELIESGVINQDDLAQENSEGLCILHIASRYNKLEAVPKALLSKKTLLYKNSKGQTVLHYATIHNQLKHIPKELLTKDVLKLKDRENNTVLHLAAYGTQLELLDNKLIDENTLFETNDYGRSPIDLLISSIDQLNDQKIFKKICKNLSTQTLKRIHTQIEEKRKNRQIMSKTQTLIGNEIIERSLKDLPKEETVEI